MLKRLALSILVLALCSATAASVIVWHWYSSPLISNSHSHTQSSSQDADDSGYWVVEIASGDTLRSLLIDMQSDGKVEFRLPVLVLAKLLGLEGIRKGEYRVDLDASPRKFLEALNTGTPVQYSVTFVEGTTADQALEQLSNNAKITGSLMSLSASQVRSTLGVTQASIEGLIFPDTYAFTRGEEDRDILRRAISKMEAVLNAEWSTRQQDLPIETPYEALILASIVEKETGVANERAEIAGVFIRRLKRGMRLQTDPTVIYGLGDRYDGNLTRAHLKAYSPYNTYRINGLPPTPIALPGREAIEAVLNPAEGESLYFVAKGDGSHYFSKTLEEHQAAVIKYQKRRRADYRSSPSN